MKKIEEKIIRFIDEHELIEKGDKILIAFSGGPDSVFALHFLNKFRKKYSIELSAIHFNHQLRGKESDEDELFSKTFCQNLGVEFRSTKLDVKKYAKSQKQSIEEAARYLRYQYLDKICKNGGFNKVVTAHNLSDNTETVLLNLLSGTSASGLSGIPIRRANIIRPILCVTKNEIIEYLAKNRIEFRVDSSNLSDDFKRNFIRNRILPLMRAKINPSLDEAVFRSTKNIEAGLVLNQKAVEYFVSNFITSENDSYKVDLKLSSIFGEIPGVILQHFLRNEFEYEFVHDDYVKINSLVNKQKGKKVNLGNAITVYREEDGLRFITKKEISATSAKLVVGEKKKIGKVWVGVDEGSVEENLKKKKNYELISADKLNDKFELRFWKPGDTFTPIGFNGTKKVSDFLTDVKIPASEKKKQLVLLNRNQIVWVVGLRISDKVKITNKTKRVYKLWTT